MHHDPNFGPQAWPDLRIGVDGAEDVLVVVADERRISASGRAEAGISSSSVVSP